jgi:Tripartite tricarboxylate transporter TctB family
MDSPNNSVPVASNTGIATYVVDAVIALMVMVMGAVVVYGSRKLGSSWTSDGPGAGYFPFYIGVILLVSGAGVLYQALKNKNTQTFVDGEQIKRVLSVLLPACVYVFAVQFIGIYLASTIYIALFMVILGKYNWSKSAIAALGVNILFFFMFEVWFKVPLYKGKLDPLGFLGY